MRHARRTLTDIVIFSVRDKVIPSKVGDANSNLYFQAKTQMKLTGTGCDSVGIKE